MDIESRIGRLEERLTWLQQHASEQDRVISSLALEIEKLTRSLLVLRRQVADVAAGGGAGEDGNAGEIPDETPPHY